MYLNEHVAYSIIRYNKNIELTREDLLTAYSYKLTYQPHHSFDFPGGFEVNVPIEGCDEHFEIVVDDVRKVVRIYISNEADMNIPFHLVRETMVNIVTSTKEYLKEHRKVDKVVSALLPD